MLINKQNVKRAILEEARMTRSHPFTRVGASAYVAIEAAVKRAIENLVHDQPSKGKTIG